MIIGVLVAVSIPIFTAQLDKAKDATNLANARSIYAQLVADYMDDSTIQDMPSGTFDGTANSTITVGSNTFKFTKVGSAKLVLPTANNAQPVVKYTHNDGTTVETFGAAS